MYELTYLLNGRHVVYDDGYIPSHVDISARRHESEIDMKVIFSFGS